MQSPVLETSHYSGVLREIFIISSKFLFLLHSQAYKSDSQRKHWVFKPDEETLQDPHNFTEAVRRINGIGKSYISYKIKTFERVTKICSQSQHVFGTD